MVGRACRAGGGPRCRVGIAILMWLVRGERQRPLRCRRWPRLRALGPDVGEPDLSATDAGGSRAGGDGAVAGTDAQPDGPGAGAPELDPRGVETEVLDTVRGRVPSGMARRDRTGAYCEKEEWRHSTLPRFEIRPESAAGAEAVPTQWKTSACGRGRARGSWWIPAIRSLTMNTTGQSSLGCGLRLRYAPLTSGIAQSSSRSEIEVPLEAGTGISFLPAGGDLAAYYCVLLHEPARWSELKASKAEEDV